MSGGGLLGASLHSLVKLKGGDGVVFTIKSKATVSVFLVSQAVLDTPILFSYNHGVGAGIAETLR